MNLTEFVINVIVAISGWKIGEFIYKHIKTQKQRQNTIDKIFTALKLLRQCGLTVKDMYANDEFIQKARASRKFIDCLWKTDKESLLWAINSNWYQAHTEFACWLDKTEFAKETMKKKGNDIEGMIFGVNIRRR